MGETKQARNQNCRYTVTTRNFSILQLILDRIIATGSDQELKTHFSNQPYLIKGKLAGLLKRPAAQKKGWRDGSVGKVFVAQEGKPEI